MKFYDTCSLLNLQEKAFEPFEEFAISTITLQELENIKTSAHKDAETKYKARKLTRLLAENEKTYTVFPYDANVKYAQQLLGFDDNNDTRIISTVKEATSNGKQDLLFVTDDICCYHLAKIAGIKVKLGSSEPEEDYTGFKIVRLSEDKLADFYTNYFSEAYIDFMMVPNEYLIIQDATTGEYIDQYKLNKEYQFEEVPYPVFNSEMFGMIKPKDVFQRCAMDSIKSNQVTMLGGPAGSGKTALALAYMFEQLEKGKFDKLVLFCNPIGAKNCAKLGYYPGTVLDKVLSTQAGHVLSSKLGSETEVERLIAENKLEIIPAVDARGYEVPSHCGCYVLEAQNLTSDTLRLLLQRVAADTKVIVDGDRVEQLDMEIYNEDNGMKKMSKVFKGTPVYGQIDLQNIYRSEIANIAEQMKY